MPGAKIQAITERVENILGLGKGGSVLVYVGTNSVEREGTNAISIMCLFEGLKMRGNLLHSDWSKFEMERFDWSCAYCRHGAPSEIPYYRSHEGHFLIGRKQFHHQGAPHGLILIGRERSRDLCRLYLHKLAYIAPFCSETVTRGRYGSIVSTVCDLVSTVLIGREPSRDL